MGSRFSSLEWEDSSISKKSKSGGSNSSLSKPSGSKSPLTRSQGQSPSSPVLADDVNSFLEQVSATPLIVNPPQKTSGRMYFALDATMSRQPTWDLATSLQAEMFSAAAEETGLNVRLLYFRGFGELGVSPWLCDPDDMVKKMSRVSCRAGRTQLERLFKYALKDAQDNQVKVLVFVGDCFEENEDVVMDLAGHLGLQGVRCFMFHEGQDPVAEHVFRAIARVTGGAYAKFDANAADTLLTLLQAAVAYASGGSEGLGRLADNNTAGRKMLKRIVDQLDGKT